MYKFIIIDDDEYSLQMLSDFMCWEDSGFCLDKAFSDSEEAIEYLKNSDVDLVFSDIKMPNKDGIAVAKFCASLPTPPIVVFISAYSDFEYARKALHFNVSDYLTKPFSVQQIKKCLSNAKNQLDKLHHPSTATPSLAVKQQLFFYELLNGGTETVTELLKKMSEVGIKQSYINNKTYIINITPIDLKHYLTHTWKHGKERFYSAFSYLVNSNSEYFSSLISFFDEQAKVIIISNGQDTEEVMDYIKLIEENFKDILKLNCDIFVDKTYSAFGDILKDNIVTKEKNAIEQAIVYINENFEKDITLEKVALHVSLSKVYFSSLFKSNTGENFTGYLNRIRIEKAIELLKNTNMKITSIAFEVGYQSIPHFYKIFSKYTGCTPVKFKELLNEKSNS